MGVVALAAALAGCGGGSSSSASSTPSTPPTATVTTTATATSSPSSAPTSTTSAPNAGGGACTDGSIRVSAGQQGAGLGHNLTVLLFHNVTSRTCDLRGYPGVTPYVHSERGTTARRTTTGYFGNAPVRVVRIRPSGVASAMVDGSDSPTDDKRSCPTYTSLKVTPPNLFDSATLEVKIPACARLTVEPVAPGKHGTTQR
jgi:hypothetical protein